MIVNFVKIIEYYTVQVVYVALFEEMEIEEKLVRIEKIKLIEPKDVSEINLGKVTKLDNGEYELVLKKEKRLEIEYEDYVNTLKNFISTNYYLKKQKERLEELEFKFDEKFKKLEANLEEMGKKNTSNRFWK